MRTVGTIALFALLACTRTSSVGSAVQSGNGVGRGATVAEENARAGDTQWRLDQPAANSEIAGFATVTSALALDTVNIKVDSGGRDFAWELHRLGWYGGAGGRRVLAGATVTGQQQASCTNDTASGLVTCPWFISFSAVVPDLPSGIFLFKLTRDDGFQAHVPIVVRESAGPRAPVLAVVGTNTWQAYNTWGGEGLYEDDGDGLANGRATVVSFDRPYIQWNGTGDLWRGESHLLRFLEARGYETAWAVNGDLDADPRLALDRRIVLSSGHDEYTTATERSALESALASGVNLAFLGADSLYWRVRLEPSAAGAPRRLEVCTKDAATDPLHQTTMWRLPPNLLAEAALVGVQYGDWSVVDFPFVVRGTTGPTAWLWAGAGVVDGDVLPLLVGYESDHRVAESPAAAVVVGSSSFMGADSGTLALHEATLTSVGRAFVFATGTNDWVLGLDDPQHADARVQIATANVLTHAGAAPATPSVELPTASRLALPIATSARVTTAAGSDGQEGFVDGVASHAQLRHPQGLALDGHGGLYVADTDNHAVRRLDLATLTLSTVADARDFQKPIALAVAADGTVLVAEAAPPLLRAIAPDVARTVRTVTAMPTRPMGLAIGADGSALIVDIYASRLWSLDPAWLNGPATLQPWAGTGHDGYGDDLALNTAFRFPTNVALADDGTAIVLDAGNFALRQIGTDAGHTVRTLAGGVQGFSDGPAPLLAAYFGLAVDERGAIYFADVGSARIRKLGPDGATTIAGNGGVGNRDGPGETATFRVPCGLALDRATRELFVADAAASTIRRIEF